MSISKMVNGIPVKELGGLLVLDFDNEKLYDKKRGTIDLIPVDGQRFIQTTFRSFYDSSTGITYGIPSGKFNDDGTPVFRKITIAGARYYNLSKKGHQKEWAVVKNAEFVQGSRMAKYNDRVLLKIHDRTEEAEKIVSKVIKSAEAIAIASRLRGQELYDFARIIGKAPDGQSEVVVHSDVIQFAQTSPKEFMEKINNQDKEAWQILERCIAQGLVKQLPGEGYIWKDQLPLGMTKAAVIEYVMKNERVLIAMNQESDRFFKKSHSESEDQKRDEEVIRETVDKSEINLNAEEIIETKEETPPTPPEKEEEEEKPLIFQGRPVTGKSENAWTAADLRNYGRDFLKLTEKEEKKMSNKSKTWIAQFLTDRLDRLEEEEDSPGGPSEVPVAISEDKEVNASEDAEEKVPETVDDGF